MTADVVATREPQPGAGRPPLPKDAGMNTIRLDLEVTREELATTLDDLFAWFNIRLQLRTHPAFFAGVALAVAGATAGLVTLIVRKRRP